MIKNKYSLKAKAKNLAKKYNISVLLFHREQEIQQEF